MIKKNLTYSVTWYIIILNFVTCTQCMHVYVIKQAIVRENINNNYYLAIII